MSIEAVRNPGLTSSERRSSRSGLIAVSKIAPVGLEKQETFVFNVNQRAN